MNARMLLAVAFATLVLSACQQRAATSTARAAASPPAIAYEAHVAAGGLVPPGGTLHNPHQGDKAVAANRAVGRWRYGGADAEVFMSIFYGRPKGMPAFGGVLGEEGVWTLVTYIRSLHKSDNLATESWEKP